jgi:hypothetical protein
MNDDRAYDDTANHIRIAAACLNHPQVDSRTGPDKRARCRYEPGDPANHGAGPAAHRVAPQPPTSEAGGDQRIRSDTDVGVRGNGGNWYTHYLGELRTDRLDRGGRHR